MLIRSVKSRESDLLLPAHPGVSRRTLLTAFGALGFGLAATVAGCTEQAVPAPLPLEPDELAVNRAVASARQLRAGALALARTEPALAALLRRIATVHEAHLRALGAPVPSAAKSTPTTPSTAPTSGSASPTPSGPLKLPSTLATPTLGRPLRTGAPGLPPLPSATPTPTTSTSTPADPTPGQQLAGEWAAARTGLRDGEAAAPAFAVLLSRIGAARATHADLLSAALGRRAMGPLTPARPEPAPTAKPTPTTSPSSLTPAQIARSTNRASPPVAQIVEPTATSSPTKRDVEPGPAALNAVNRLLAGEHAAVFAYPLIIARTGGRPHVLASALWQEHRQERDRLEVRLLAAGTQPVASQPAYNVGTAPTTTARAAALAARVERGLAALAADLIGTAAGATRDLGADQLVLAARRTASWTGRPDAFPGLVTPPGATPTPTADDT